jgi:hypothetical protein
MGRNMYLPNGIKLNPNFAEILLYNKGGVECSRTSIELQDVHKVLPYKWCLSDHGYVVTGAGKTRQHLHRLIADIPDNMETDHIDGDKLNNRRSNLRVATRKNNNQNRRAWGVTSKYKGVAWKKQTRKWCALIGVDKKRIHLGYFLSETDAALAYDTAAKQFFGEYARLNFA